MKKFILLFFVSIIFVCCKSEPYGLVKIEGSLLPITDAIESDKAIEAIIKPYSEKVEKEMSTEISYTSKSLTKSDGIFESTLGNLLADLCYERANPVFLSRTGKNIDFVMFNHGGIRAGISKGDVTTRNAFELMPFENSLVVVELSGKKVAELFQYLIKGKRAHPLSKQLRLVLRDDSVKSATIKNEPFDSNKNYYVLTSDFLQQGGDNMNFLKNPVSLHPLDYKIRNAFIDYCKEKDTLKSELDGRFIKENDHK